MKSPQRCHLDVVSGPSFSPKVCPGTHFSKLPITYWAKNYFVCTVLLNRDSIFIDYESLIVKSFWFYETHWPVCTHNHHPKMDLKKNFFWKKFPKFLKNLKGACPSDSQFSFPGLESDLGTGPKHWHRFLVVLLYFIFYFIFILFLFGTGYKVSAFNLLLSYFN